MTGLLRKLHIYSGLLVFSQLLVYGVAGLVATAQPSLERPKTPHTTRTIAFQRKPDESDKQVAARAYETVQPAMSRPVPDWFLRKSADGHLLLDFYNINGIYRVTVLPTALRVESIRNSTALFFEDIHAATLADSEADQLIRIWAMWNELGIWGLLFFAVSGIWLWLASRPGSRLAWFSLALGIAVFAGLWMVLR